MEQGGGGTRHTSRHDVSQAVRSGRGGGNVAQRRARTEGELGSADVGRRLHLPGDSHSRSILSRRDASTPHSSGGGQVGDTPNRTSGAPPYHPHPTPPSLEMARPSIIMGRDPLATLGILGLRAV